MMISLLKFSDGKISFVAISRFICAIFNKSEITMHNPNRPYRRTEIDLLFTKVKAQMHQVALARGGDVKAHYIDCYTGETLRGGNRYDYEHIRSSEAVFMAYRDRLTNSEIAEVINCPENVAVTLRSINQSKGKIRLEEWLSNSTNVSNHRIDVALSKNAAARADRGIQQKAKEVLSRKQEVIR